MLKLSNIRKEYKVADTTVEALKGISLEFRKNEFVSVLGPSGCGKTTTLNIIGGLDKYTSGDLSIFGKSTKEFKDVDWDTYRNHRIGFIFQSYNLIPHLSILGNVELSLTIRGVSKAERKQRAINALEKVGLAEQINKKPNQLSGGQMQRVAIARALVNDPQILLADEPTGALDSETSIQIMELIKEISKDKLVIMVTHNKDLAVQYSTRVIELLDGQIINDSNPYDSKGEVSLDVAEDFDENGIELSPKEKKKRRKRTSMSFLTALSLSGRNLISKKGRTIITSIAGSIGIIGVCLVLALSAGFSGYIDDMQEEMLSYYPLEINETTYDLSAFTDVVKESNTPDIERLNDKVYVDSFLTRLAGGLTINNNITQEYINYIEDMDSNLYNSLMYEYGTNYSSNIYSKSKLSSLNNEYDNYSLTSIYDYYVTMLSTNSGALAQEIQMGDLTSMYASIKSFSSVINKIPNNKEFVLSQYDIVSGTYCDNADEMVLVVSNTNEIYDLTLAQLGYYTEEEFLNLFLMSQKDESDPDYVAVKNEFSYEEICSQQLYYMPNNYAFTQDGNTYTSNYRQDESNLTENGIKIKITGVLKLKEGVTQGCLLTGLNYTDKFEQMAFETSLTSNLVNAISNNTYSIKQFDFSDFLMTAMKVKDGTATADDYTKLSTMNFYSTKEKTDSDKRVYGGNNLANYIAIYTTDFETKDSVIDYLDAWNEADGHENKQIAYTDTVSIMIGFIKTIITAITAVLIAFTSISLVVSSVMIGIITYVSVVERTKEIGVLRAIGSRKRDIKNVFNAETTIIGTCSGLFGVAVTYLLSLLANSILVKVTGIAGLCALPIAQAGLMILISITLTLIAGLIPASKAAKKEPVVALRTE